MPFPSLQRIRRPCFKKIPHRMSENNNNSNESTTLKHKKSRILGTSNSQTSLNSHLDTNGKQVEADPDKVKVVNNDKNWTLWPKRNSTAVERSELKEPFSSPKPDIQPSNNSIKSQESSTSVHEQVSSPPPPGDDSSIKSHDSHDLKKERESSWISWRKPSLTSLKNSALQHVPTHPPSGLQQQQTVDDDGSSSINADDKVKSVINNNGPVLKTERSTSWSFWNSTTNANTTNSEPLSNVLLNGGEAILFETTDIKEDVESSPKKVKSSVGKQLKISNKVVPGFEKSLPLYTTTSSLVNNFNRLKYTLGFSVDDPKHLYRTQTKPKNIKKVLIIGVHGFFPTKVLRPLIGEPTGTSIKFVNEAEKTIYKWLKDENLHEDVQIQKIALEKEGKIIERVEFFYEVLQKWQDDLNSADYIYIAAHSQGCPVSLILFGRLIESGILSVVGKKISLLAMAGINNGPFYGADQRLFVRAYSTIENDSLMELFQFQKFDSFLSKELLKNLKVLIQHNNIKITFIGSINDQLVPLYSSTCLHVRHPNIFRATYIDGGSNTPDFVSRAVSIANHLHNLGYSDHGLIKEISNSLAGPLTGGGHSKIYNDPQVYEIALNFSLYTNDLKYEIPLCFKPYGIETLGINPYHLPWCMRGLIFEAKQHFNSDVADDEINNLFIEFENWKPETKQLKDMKYRLNGIKSKL